MQILGQCLSLVSAACLAVTACTTTSQTGFEETQIIERMESYDETPEFATGSKVMWAEGKDVFFANITTMNGDARPESCLKAAGVEARVEMLKYLKENITNSGQLNKLDAESDPGFEAFTAFLAKGQLSGARIMDRYYDYREVSTTDGERVLKLRCAVKMAIKKQTLEKQLRMALNGRQQGNTKVRQRLLDAQRQFLEQL